MEPFGFSPNSSAPGSGSSPVGGGAGGSGRRNNPFHRGSRRFPRRNKPQGGPPVTGRSDATRGTDQRGFTLNEPSSMGSLIQKAIAKNGKKGPFEPSAFSLKEGFRREEGPREPHKPAIPPFAKGGAMAGKQGGKPSHGGKRTGGKGKRGGRGGGAFSRPARMNTYKHKPYLKTGSEKDILESPPQERLKITVLGGNEEVGRNCTMLEYGNDIIIIDLGLQFPDEDMPGVDYIIPNISCLKGKERNIRGVIITHAHYDHIGGIPHLMPRLGNPPLFTSGLTAGIIKKRQEDHRDSPPLNLHVVKSDDTFRLGVFEVEFFGVAHSVPSSMGVIVNTPCGIIVHTGDFKLDPDPGAQSIQETEKIKRLGERNVLALMIDSTNATQTGRQLPEYEIQRNIDEIISNAKGRIIIGTFASMISRIQQIILACERHGRKVAVEGFSMRSNVAIAQELGFMKVQKGTLIETKEAVRLPLEKVAIVCTGAQGEERAVLMRIANREHQLIEIEPGDTVVFSSSVIPGNERSVQRVKDTLYREGAEVIHYKMMDVHAGGHAKQDDLVDMHKMIKPKYLIPIEGHYSFLCEHVKAAVKAGFPEDNCFIADNGQIIEFDRKGTGQLTNKKVPTEYVFVDGLGVGDTNHIILRDRQELAGDGVVVVIAVVSDRTGKLMNLPDIISRGFIYMKEHTELIQGARKKVAQVLKDDDPRSSANAVYLKDKIREELGNYLYQKTERRPMILPILVEV